MSKPILFALTLVALPVLGQQRMPFPDGMTVGRRTASNDTEWHGAVGLGRHTSGPLVTGVLTSPSRWGGFVSFAQSTTSESELPPLATGPANWSVEKTMKDQSMTLGMAYRYTFNATFGVGYTSRKEEKAWIGIQPSPLQWVSKPGRETKTTTGPAFMVEVGMRKGAGFQLVLGTTGASGAVTFRW